MNRAYYNKNEGCIRGFDLRKPGVKIGYGLMILLGVLIFVACVLPILWVILGGFKENKELIRGVKSVVDKRYYPQFLPVSFSLEGYIDTWRATKFFRFYLNSFVVVIGSVVCALLFNGLMAYSISRLKPRGHKLVYALVMATLMVPATTSVVPLYINIVDIGLRASYLPLWLSVGANAFYVVLFKNFYDSMPGSLLEAARLDGCNNLQLFFKIVLPLSMPINMVIVIYAINGAWSDFLLPYLLLDNTPLRTVMVRLFEYRTSNKVNEVDIIQAIVFSIIPPIVLFIIFQRKITSNVTAVGIKG